MYTREERERDADRRDAECTQHSLYLSFLCGAIDCMYIMYLLYITKELSIESNAKKFFQNTNHEIFSNQLNYKIFLFFYINRLLYVRNFYYESETIIYLRFKICRNRNNGKKNCQILIREMSGNHRNIVT